MPLVLGGQAVYEGVMLRSPRYLAIAVRTADGQIVVYSEPVTSIQGIWRRPFLRGVIALYDALALGLRAMRLSLQLALPEEEKHIAEPKSFAWQAAAGLSLAILLFIVLPHLLSTRLDLANRWVFSGVEGLVRLMVFLCFLWFVGRSQEAQRLFAYHGAEHKAVHAFEHQVPLTVEHLKSFSPEHPRCGTSFLLFVLVVKIVLFAFLPFGSWQGVLLRIVMLPVVAGVSFELLRLGANNPVMKWLAAPGLWLQKLTTRQPDEQQLEVALAALNEVLRLEGVTTQPSQLKQASTPSE